MKNNTLKKLKFLILALVISLFFNLSFIFSYFYQYQQQVTIYSGSEQQHIDKIVEILELSGITYKTMTKNILAGDNDNAVIISINIHRNDLAKASSLIATEW